MSNEQISATQQHDEVAPTASPGRLDALSVTDDKRVSLRVRARHVLILGGLTALGPLSTDMYLPALPSVSHDLGATVSLAQITLTACILGLSLGQVIAGPISDARGRLRPLLTGIAVYALASLLCGIAPNVVALTVLRFVQGFAGATGIVLALAIARDLYAGLALARAISLLMAVNFIAPIAAPVLGGQILAVTSWHWVFIGQALIGVVFLTAIALTLGETLPADRRQHAGIATTWRVFGSLLADRYFAGYALCSGFAFAVGIVYISASPFILENSYGLTPQIVSLVFGINALGLTIMAQIGAKLIGKVSPQTLLRWGVMMIAVAGILLLAIALSGVGLPGILPCLFVATASLGLIAPNATALALANTNAQTAGSAAALLGVVQFSIGAFAAPLVGLGGATSAIPMAAAIALFGVATPVTLIALRRSGRTATQACKD
ncbi:MAG TPA: multidrug effflux MFS transporter [Ktedonobacterales bacterium]|nr:multidrug effflux MFS transporter [Ktedonobacterales bacterium]